MAGGERDSINSACNSVRAGAFHCLGGSPLPPSGQLGRHQRAHEVNVQLFLLRFNQYGAQVALEALFSLFCVTDFTEFTSF